jgi:hypothetical protein
MGNGTIQTEAKSFDLKKNRVTFSMCMLNYVCKILGSGAATETTNYIEQLPHKLM